MARTMMRYGLGCIGLVLATLATQAEEMKNMVRNGHFTEWVDGCPTGWTHEAPREAVRPNLSRRRGAGEGAWAELDALPNGVSIGWLEQVVPVEQLVRQGKLPKEDWLRFHCRVRVAKGQSSLENVLVALFWLKAPATSGWSPPVRYFVPLVREPGEQTLYLADIDIPVIENGGDLKIMLTQYGGQRGSVSFADVSLVSIPPPPPRIVKIAAAYYMPKGPGDWQRNLAGIDRLAGEAAGKQCDLILFGEGVTVVGSGKSFYDVAEPIPGPASNDLAAVAAKHGIFLVAGLYERDGDAAYNTAVMFDRHGELVGTYRKVHLPHPELFGGLMPGPGFPVFDTELGRIGIQICYDHHFQESSRCLAVAGAEIILTPIWGDMRSDGECYDAVARTRALDNGVFYVMSVYSLRRSLIVDPLGRILAATTGEDTPNLAIAECNLRLLSTPKWPYHVPPNIQQGYRVERRPSAYGNMLDKTP